MPPDAPDQMLRQLEEAKVRFGPGAGSRVRKLLAALARRDFPDPASLIRFHDALLFLRAHPQDPAVLRATSRLLDSFFARVDRLRAAGADMSVFDPESVSGVAGTVIEDTLNYDVVRWLADRFPGKLSINWEGYEEDARLAATLPRFLPLLEDDSQVEADVPFQEYLRAARGRHDELQWLLRRFHEWPASDQHRAELYNSLSLFVRWDMDNLKASRTRNWSAVRRPFYHQQPLLRRSDVSLETELASPPPPLRRLSRRAGERIMDLIREIMAVRYRELYGTTLGDPASVVEANPGRGVQIYLWGLPPARRLPLRAYLAGFTLKNGVPINYIEGISLFEWMEVGFNTFYAYREGESAWLYAQALRLLCRLHGVKCISVYPYQIGYQNEEAIASGAFWFYRKLGFRPGRPELLRLAEREERKIAATPGYRTPARVLRKLATGHVFYELPGAQSGAWDRFSVRNIGLAVNRRMGARFDGNPAEMRRAATAALARLLHVRPEGWHSPARAAFEDFALVLSLVPDFHRWSDSGKKLLLRIIRAKAAAGELGYMRLLQKHARLRAALQRLGSS